MLKKLHKLVINSYIGPLIMTFFIAEFVLIMQFLWLYIGDLVGKGLEWYVIAELLMYASARLTQMALPLAILLASIMTFGNMGEHFELSAMKSAGISLQKIMKPLIVFSVSLAIASFLFANYVIPYTNLKMGALLYDISNKRPEMNIKPSVFSNDIKNFSIKIKGKSSTSNMMYGFMIYDHRSHRGNVKITLADSGFMEITRDQKFMIINLFGGKSYEEIKDDKPVEKNRPSSTVYFDKQVSVFALEGLDMKRTNENLFRQNHHMKRISQLSSSKDSLSKVLYKKNKQSVNHLLATNYFKYEIKYNKSKDSLQYLQDSINKLRPPDSLQVIVDVDSLYNTMNNRDRAKVISIALETAKSAQKYISVTQKDFKDRQKIINKHDIAWHEKFTMALACLIFFFIGAPLGAIIRKGGFGLPILVSIIFFILYYVVSLMGRKFVEEGALVAWQGMWISTAITVPLGVFFTYKATTDSVLFDIGSYIEFFKRPFNVTEIQHRDPDVVFHRDVQNIDENSLLDKVLLLQQDAKNLSAEIPNTYKSIIPLYKSHFYYDTSKLEQFNNDYNRIYSNITLKNRGRGFYYESLKKFPRINIEDYQLNKKGRIWFYIFLTIGIVPIGVLILITSYLKHKTLKEKIDIIDESLNPFIEQIKNKDLVNEQDDLIDSEESKSLGENIRINIDDVKEIDDKLMLSTIFQTEDSLNNSLSYLKEQTSTILGFLKLVFTNDIEKVEHTTSEIGAVKMMLNKKFSNHPTVAKLSQYLKWIDFEQYRRSRQHIFINYILYGFIMPLAIPVFYMYYNKIQNFINDLQNIKSDLANLADFIKTGNYETQADTRTEALCVGILDKNPNAVTNEDLDILIGKLDDDILNQVNFLKDSNSSIFEYMYFCLTNDFAKSTKKLNLFYDKIKSVVQNKYRDNKELMHKFEDFFQIRNLEFKQTKPNIFINYLLVMAFPVGILVFLLRKKGLVKVQRKFENAYQAVHKLKN